MGSGVSKYSDSSGIFYFLSVSPHVDLPPRAIPWAAKRLKVSQHTLELLLYQYKTVFIMGATKSEAIRLLENLAFEALKKRYPSFPYPVKPKYSDKSANALTTCVIDYIQLRGFQAERINTTGTFLDTGKGRRWIKGSSQPGSADISATIQSRSVKIEIKCAATRDLYQSEAQKNYQKQIEAAGGVYLIIRTFQEFYDWFNRKNQNPNGR